jgi:Ca-activated chloride channel family protein
MNLFGLGHPWFFLLLVPIAVFAYLDATRQVTVGARWPNISRLWASRHKLDLSSPIPPPRVRWRFWLGLTFLALALVQPRYGYLRVPLEEQAKDIVVALDLSRSMLSKDVKPSRLENAKLIIQNLLASVPGDRVGLVLFSGTAYMQLPLSTDYEIFAGFLPQLTPDYFPQGGTNFEAMLNTSIEAFGKEADGERFLFVLSDGETFDDKWQALIPKLQELKIHVIGLGIGTSGGALIPLAANSVQKDSNGNDVLSHLKPSTLETLAKATNGTYTPAATWVNAADILKRTAALGEKNVNYQTDETRLIERYQWLLVPALVLLCLSFWHELPVRPRARDIKVSEAEAGVTPAATPKRTRAAVAVASLLLAAWLAHPISLHAQDTSEMQEDADKPANPRLPMNSLGNLLTKRVEDILKNKKAGAYDYVSMVIDSVAYMEATLKARQRFPLSMIDDCRAAIAIGEKLDKEGGDWPKLRDDLDRLYKMNTEPWGTAAPDAAGKSEIATGFDPNNDMAIDEKATGNASQYDNPTANTGPVKKSFATGSAFGAIDVKKADLPPVSDVPLDEQPQAASSDSQQIGGERNAADIERDAHPELAMPLQKLEHVRNQDSPAKLFQMLEGNKNNLMPQGPDW